MQYTQEAHWKVNLSKYTNQQLLDCTLGTLLNSAIQNSHALLGVLDWLATLRHRHTYRERRDLEARIQQGQRLDSHPIVPTSQTIRKLLHHTPHTHIPTYPENQLLMLSMGLDVIPKTFKELKETCQTVQRHRVSHVSCILVHRKCKPGKVYTQKPWKIVAV